MSKPTAYSLWLMPTGDVYNKLNNIIYNLSKKYSAPSFKPHVTLIGGILKSEEAMVSKTAQLASVIHPYKIELFTVDYLDEFYRCLFLKAKETDEVIKANVEARKIFDKQENTPYMPHLSLMYGDFSPEMKEKIIMEIGKEFNLNFKVNNIHLFSCSRFYKMLR